MVTNYVRLNVGLSGSQSATHRIREPSVGNEGSLLFHAHDFAHVVEAGVVGHKVVERRLVLFDDAWMTGWVWNVKHKSPSTEIASIMAHMDKHASQGLGNDGTRTCRYCRSGERFPRGPAQKPRCPLACKRQSSLFGWSRPEPPAPCTSWYQPWGYFQHPADCLTASV